MDFNMPLRQRRDKKINAARRNKKKFELQFPFARSIVKMSFKRNLYIKYYIIVHTIVPR